VEEESKERLAVKIVLKQKYRHIRTMIHDLPPGKCLMQVSAKKMSKNKQLKPSQSSNNSNLSTEGDRNNFVFVHV
jgi:hypothetical protein